MTISHLVVATALLLTSLRVAAHAAEWPSFLRVGDAFCTNEADYDDFVTQGRIRPDSAVETCETIDRPTRVAVMHGRGGIKSMVMVRTGPFAYEVGWTNGALPLAR